MEFAEHLYHLLKRHTASGFYVWGTIPKTKMDQATVSFPIDPKERVLALIDCTLLGSCDAGMAITDQGLTWRNNNSTPTSRLSWEDFFANRKFIRLTEQEVIFGRQVFYMGYGRMGTKKAYQLFISLGGLLAELFKGQVKTFFKDKGYGYITSVDGKEYYFSMLDVKGVNSPNPGDMVSFDIANTRQGPKASMVTIIKRAKLR